MIDLSRVVIVEGEAKDYTGYAPVASLAGKTVEAVGTFDCVVGRLMVFLFTDGTYFEFGGE